MTASVSPDATEAPTAIGRSADRPGLVGGDLVLHLHGLDDGTRARPPRRSRPSPPRPCSTVALQRRGQGVAAGGCAALTRAAPGALASRRLAAGRSRGRGAVAHRRGADDLDVEALARDLDRVGLLHRRSSSSAPAGSALGNASSFSHSRSSIEVAAGLAVGPLVGGQQRLVEGDQGLEPVDLVLAAARAACARVACSRSTSQTISLATIGSYMRRDLRAGWPRPSRRARRGRRARRSAPTATGRGGEVLGRVLGVDAALDGVAAQLDVVLADRELLAGGDADALAHDVDARDHLGHAVLDLDAGVHLEEEVLAVRPAGPRSCRRRRSRRRARPRWRSRRCARAARRRPRARATPRSASGGGAAPSSRARPGG